MGISREPRRWMTLAVGGALGLWVLLVYFVCWLVCWSTKTKRRLRDRVLFLYIW